MRPYAKTSDHPAFLYDGHHRIRFYRMRRDHRIPRDQSLRREQRSAARAEEREIVRAELREWREGLAAEAGEQAAPYLGIDLSYSNEDYSMLSITWNDLLDTWDLINAHSAAAERLWRVAHETIEKHWQVRQAWQEHDEAEAILDRPIPWWEEAEALDRYEATGKLDVA
jgi:hypothetical protein